MYKYEHLQRKMKHCLIFLHEIVYFTVVFIKILSSSLLISPYYVVITQPKHDVVKVCSIEYLTTEIELMLPTFKSWTANKIIEY